MAGTEKRTNPVSPKGTILQPREWSAGAGLTVEETDDGMPPKPASAFAETRPEDVFGMLAHKGKQKSITEMDAAVLAEARHRHARD